MAVRPPGARAGGRRPVTQRLRELEELWQDLGGRRPDDGDVLLPYGDGLDPVDLPHPERSHLAAFGAQAFDWEPADMRPRPDPQSAARLAHRAGRGSPPPRPDGSPLRRATHDVASFRVVDGIRAGVVVRRHGRARGAWTFDPVHTRMLTRLFEVSWDEARPEGDDTR